jgi:hypothetical protein
MLLLRVREPGLLAPAAGEREAGGERRQSGESGVSGAPHGSTKSIAGRSSSGYRNDRGLAAATRCSRARTPSRRRTATPRSPGPPSDAPSASSAPSARRSTRGTLSRIVPVARSTLPQRQVDVHVPGGIEVAGAPVAVLRRAVERDATRPRVAARGDPREDGRAHSSRSTCTGSEKPGLTIGCRPFVAGVEHLATCWPRGRPCSRGTSPPPRRRGRCCPRRRSPRSRSRRSSPARPPPAVGPRQPVVLRHGKVDAVAALRPAVPAEEDDAVALVVAHGAGRKRGFGAAFGP